MQLRGVAVIVPKQAAQAFVAPNVAIAAADFVTSLDDGVVQALVIPLGMIMEEILANGSAEPDGKTEVAMRRGGQEPVLKLRRDLICWSMVQ